MPKKLKKTKIWQFSSLFTLEIMKPWQWTVSQSKNEGQNTSFKAIHFSLSVTPSTSWAAELKRALSITLPALTSVVKTTLLTCPWSSSFHPFLHTSLGDSWILLLVYQNLEYFFQRILLCMCFKGTFELGWSHTTICDHLQIQDSGQNIFILITIIQYTFKIIYLYLLTFLFLVACSFFVGLTVQRIYNFIFLFKWMIRLIKS